MKKSIRTALAGVALAISIPGFAAADGVVGSDDPEVSSESSGEKPATVKPGAQGAIGAQTGIVCKKTFTSGGNGNDRFRWCFNNTGNIVQYEGPGTFEHINVGTAIDGYVLCSNGVVIAHDNTLNQSGFSGAPSGSGNNVVRQTASGIRLEQQFSNEAINNTAGVKMTVRNNSAGTLSNVTLLRLTDWDLNGNTTNTFFASRLGVTAMQGLTHASLWSRAGSLSDVRITSFNSTAACTYAAAASGSTGDFMAVLTYNLGNLNPGQAKTVNVGYRLQQ